MILSSLIGLAIFALIVGLVAYVIVRILEIFPNVPQFVPQIIWLIALLIFAIKAIEVLSAVFTLP